MRNSFAPYVLVIVLLVVVLVVARDLGTIVQHFLASP